MNSPSEKISIWKESELWVIRHEPSDVTTQGESRIHALLMLADAMSGVNGTHSTEELQEMAEDVFTPDYGLLEEIGEE